MRATWDNLTEHQQNVLRAAAWNGGGLTAGDTLARFGLGDKTVDQEVPSLYSVEDEQFRRIMSAMLGPPLLNGNRTATLVNGDSQGRWWGGRRRTATCSE